MKWQWKALTLLGILLGGWLIYETVSGYFIRNTLNTTIEQYRKNEADLRDRLTADAERIRLLTDTVSTGETRNSELEAELERSKKYADSLHADNLRLGSLLTGGIESTGRLGEYVENIEDSIDRSRAIFDRINRSEYTE